MEAKSKKRSTQDDTKRNLDEGAYVTPEILAAEAGEQVEFGVQLEDHDPKE